MTLIKTSFLNSIAVAIKMLTLLALNKIMAIYLGPSGYAVLGQMQNAIQIIVSFSTSFAGNGVTKYTAEYADSKNLLRTLWRTSFFIGMIVAFSSALVIWILRNKISIFFFKNEDYGFVFSWFSISLIFFFLNTLFLSVLNGKKEVRLYVTANIAGSITAMMFSSLMTYFWGLNGALISLVTVQSISFSITFFVIKKSEWFSATNFIGLANKVVGKKLIKFALTSIVSAICIPTCYMLLRNILIDDFNLILAGYWEAMWRLSSAYLMFLTATLSVYFLPRFSELKSISEIKNEIFNSLKIIIPFVLFVFSFVYFFRSILIQILFSKDFSEMSNLFIWQLFGDFFKICGWIFGYIMLGQAMIKSFIFLEIIFSLSFYLISYWMLKKIGIQGIGVSHLIVSILYLAAARWLVFYNLKVKNV